MVAATQAVPLLSHLVLLESRLPPVRPADTETASPPCPPDGTVAAAGTVRPFRTTNDVARPIPASGITPAPAGRGGAADVPALRVARLTPTGRPAMVDPHPAPLAGPGAAPEVLRAASLGPGLPGPTRAYTRPGPGGVRAGAGVETGDWGLATCLVAATPCDRSLFSLVVSEETSRRLSLGGLWPQRTNARKTSSKNYVSSYTHFFLDLYCLPFG